MSDDPCAYWERRWRLTGSPGDRDELIAAYVPRALGIARGVLRKLPSSVDPDSLTGAALEVLTRAVHAFDPERGVPLSAWVQTRVHHGVIDEYRRSRHRREVSQAHDVLDRHEGGTGDPSVATAERDQQAHALAVLAQLPERERLLVDASVHDVTVRSMALVLGISEGRASRLRSRALTRLRDALEAA